MTLYNIGEYGYFASIHHDFYTLIYRPGLADQTDRVKICDRMMHQSLDKIFRERCLGSSEQFKEFLRGPQHNTDYNSIIEPILKQEPSLSRYFSKEELGKFSLLWIALLCGYKNSAELLVRSGADVNEPFGRHDPQVIDEKCAVLHLLLQMDPSPENERLIRLIVDHGADLHARDQAEERTVLHYAVEKDRIRMAKMLLEKGADVNVADNAGMTPLLAALGYSHKANELVPLLLEFGANVFAKESAQMNALHVLANGHGDHAELARLFIDRGVSLHDKRHDNRQPIHSAAENGKSKLVELYLDRGANVNALADHDLSPLFLAAQSYEPTVVKTLLERGANIDLRTIDGHTALHAACKSATFSNVSMNDRKHCEAIIRILLSAGADVVAEESDGATPLVFISFRENGERLGQESWPLIKALALRKALQPSIELKDEKIIERHPKSQNYYRICAEEVDKMKCTSFIETCTFFQLITKSRCQIAALMQNPEFETQFRLYDLNEFPIYAEVIVRAFERAQEHCNSLLEQVNLITEAFYNKLPYLVVKKVVGYNFNNCCSENMK